MSYIGAESIISPLGNCTEENWDALCANRTGISLVEGAGFNGGALHLARMENFQPAFKFENLLVKILADISDKIDPAIISSDRTLVIISSTKGAINESIRDQFASAVQNISRRFSLRHIPLVISNACISGVLAINAGGNLIRAGHYDHVVVLGCDVISDFVVFGFQSLFAISNRPCAPFDASRNGITMGEGCAGVVLSKSLEIYREPPLRLLEGASANDANHISGPSRTGEGLFRAVTRTLADHSLTASDIDFISAHGTATVYNDEMEAIAFDRLGMNHIPLNSLKGYFGHTLGAAGVIETTASMQMLRKQTLIRCLGFENSGTSKELNIVKDNIATPLHTILKTASGFGGGNASLIIRNL
ncbi:3-oxoacyl-[acyl-carrier-protein] synthase 2 [Dyadobacter sp. CECT 9275]|uniref:3-oxoacyl-[acyl-carrier-protein] synthase 2 n=1 Tax=Dyadobacter helix TaxID=2822344 RepID=A0A916NB69_9BACT|nr:beta-ketoacyl synthase N-terminal-like domain-containing protein [Dyadobacter sp. CECT 9275]CAG4995039.1 3-oxoacyl-[acyl-carrier-protein] synthase 2 [Dyadobacter sp. CECT 9275]